MCAGSDGLGDFGEMDVHRLGIAARQNQAAALPLWTDRAEEIGRFGALIVWRAGPRATLGPAASDLVLLTDASFVLEPDFDLSPDIDALSRAICLQLGREVFLKASTATSVCA